MKGKKTLTKYAPYLVTALLFALVGLFFAPVELRPWLTWGFLGFSAVHWAYREHDT